MWRNPKYQADGMQHDDHPPTAAPPCPSGRLIAAFPRPGRGRPDEELRVVLDQFQGHDYIAVRLWTRDHANGGWFPTRKGLSVRLAEAQGVAEAILEAAGLAPSSDETTRHDHNRDRGTTPTRTGQDGDWPPADGFDEFGR